MVMTGTFRYASRRYWDALFPDLKPIYIAVNASAAEEASAYLEWGCPFADRMSAASE